MTPHNKKKVIGRGICNYPLSDHVHNYIMLDSYALSEILQLNPEEWWIKIPTCKHYFFNEFDTQGHPQEI